MGDYLHVMSLYLCIGSRFVASVYVCMYICMYVCMMFFVIVCVCVVCMYGIMLTNIFVCPSASGSLIICMCVYVRLVCWLACMCCMFVRVPVCMPDSIMCLCMCVYVPAVLLDCMWDLYV